MISSFSLRLLLILVKVEIFMEKLDWNYKSSNFFMSWCVKVLSLVCVIGDPLTLVLYAFEYIVSESKILNFQRETWLTLLKVATFWSLVSSHWVWLVFKGTVFLVLPDEIFIALKYNFSVRICARMFILLLSDCPAFFLYVMCWLSGERLKIEVFVWRIRASFINKVVT